MSCLPERSLSSMLQSEKLTTNAFVRMEVLPKAVYFHRQDEVACYETFFASAQLVPFSEALIAQAHSEACRACLRALDARILLRRRRPVRRSLSPPNGQTTALFRVVGITIVAQFIAVCRRSKWSKHLTNSPLLALLCNGWGLMPPVRSAPPAQRHSADESSAGTERSPRSPGGWFC